MQDKSVRDSRIALGVTVAVHALFLCWLLSQENPIGSAGSSRSDGSTGLHVEFVEVAPTVAANKSAGDPAESAKNQTSRDLAGIVVADGELSAESAQSSTEAPVEQPAIASSTDQTSSASSSARSGPSDPEREGYLEVLKNAILTRWAQLHPEQSVGHCVLKVQQIPGGSVASVQAVNCSMTELDQRALEEATLLAQPLPYAGYESVFTDEVDLVF